MKLRPAVILIILLISISGVSAVFAQDIPQSACLITDVGILNDGGFNQSTYNGLQRAVEEFGIEDTFIETQAPTDYANNINTCLDNGYDIIITVGYALADATYEAALNNPDHYFIGVDQDFLGVIPSPNLVGLQFREDQGGFLAGVMAGLMTETGIVGGVYGEDIAPVIKFRHGFEQGVRYINPTVQALGSYSESFETPDRGAETALTLIGEGADVIFGAGGRTGTGAIREAAARGVRVIGVDLDQYFTDFAGGEAPGAENIITSAIKRVDNGIYDLIAALINGEGFPANSTYIISIANEGIGFAPPHDADVPQEVLDQLQAVLEGLRDGTIVTGVDPITGEMLPGILGTANEAGNFTIFLEAVSAAGLAGILTDRGPFTVFAPNDTAFAVFLDAQGLTIEELLVDVDFLNEVLLYHVTHRALTADALTAQDGQTIQMLNGGEVRVNAVGNALALNESVNVIAIDIFAVNGVTHVIDAVLVPPSE